MSRWLGRAVVGVTLASLVLVGVAGRAAILVMGWSSGTSASAQQSLADRSLDGGSLEGSLPFADAGPHAVGMRELPVPGEPPLRTYLWYPARQDSPPGAMSYAYGMKVFGGDSPVALASYAGRARRDAPPDLALGPYPVVILSPGFAIGATSYAWLAEHLASHGLVVVAIEHAEALDPSGLWRATVARPGAIGAVLDHVQEQARTGTFAGLADMQRVAVVGHSYGGYTALAAAGARLDTGRMAAICERAYATADPVTFLCDALLPRVGDMASLAGLADPPWALWPSWSDPRIDAAVALAGDAVMFGEAGLAEVSVPVMTIGGTMDVDAPFDWGTRLAYERSGGDRQVEIGLEGAEHLVFTGPCETSRRFLRILSQPFCTDPAWQKERAHAVVGHFVAAFLRAELADDAAAARALDPRGISIPDLAYRAQGYGDD
jgi:predicted dienelactone hydrolase